MGLGDALRQRQQQQASAGLPLQSVLGAEEDYSPPLNSSSFTGHDPEAQIALNIKKLQESYSEGIKSSRFITSRVLMDAPAGYFERHSEIVKACVADVQESIRRQSKTDVLAAAAASPTDEDKQNAAYWLVRTGVYDFLERKGNSYSGTQKAIIANLVVNELIGFGPLDPLWRDHRIDEIVCNGPKDIQVEISGQMEKVPGCTFRDVRHLHSLIERLYRHVSKTLTPTTPIIDGRLHDFSRMAAVHEVIAPNGPNFVIRRHKAAYLPPQKIIDWGTANEELMTFLGNMIYKQCSLLVIGGTSSGKTTLLGALSGFLRTKHRILTLEDNIELKLAPSKYRAAAMETIPMRYDDPKSEVSMRTLVKAALRLRPDAIIVGEVRDGSAYDLCQALNTGHYGMSTLHANDADDSIYRLVSLVSQGGLMQGVHALPLIAASFDFIVHVERFPSDGSRRIVAISEVASAPSTNPRNGELQLETKPIWRFVTDSLDSEQRVVGHWEKVNEVSPERRARHRLDLEKDLTWEELKKLSEG